MEESPQATQATTGTAADDRVARVPAFLRTLQITDSFFPVGAFAYSDGLETATDSGRVHDVATLADWIDHFIDAVYVPTEGRALAQAMDALARGDFECLGRIDRELTALRPSREARRSSTGVGRRLIAVYSNIAGDEDFHAMAGHLPDGNAAPAYGVVYFHAGVTTPDALAAFGYIRLAGTVSAAIRLMALGQEQGQRLLTRMLARLPEAGERIVRSVDEPLRSFCPRLDVEQMNHQYVYSRLFRS